MESERVRDGDRTLVPHRYAIHLAPPTSPPCASPPALAADLADAALGFARSHGYRLADRPTVALIADVDGRARRRPGRGEPRAPSGARAPVEVEGASRRVTATAAATRSAADRPDRGLRRPGRRRRRGRRLREVRPDGSTPVVRRRRPPADDRPRPRQRARPARTAGPRATTPGSTAARARCSWPISGARTARGSTTAGSRRSRSGRATGSGSATRSSSSSRSRTPDGRLRPSRSGSSGSCSSPCSTSSCSGSPGRCSAT